MHKIQRKKKRGKKDFQTLEINLKGRTKTSQGGWQNILATKFANSLGTIRRVIAVVALGPRLR
jgi:hypothetical protein